MTKFIYHHELEVPTQQRLDFLKRQVQKLLKEPQPKQRSELWYKMRKNRITASDWATALGEHERSYKKSLILNKCGESKSFNNAFMQHGVKYETVANMIYEHRNTVTVLEFGLLGHPTIDFLGASPDGITEDGVMVEIKCPSTREITGIPKHYYWCQVQGQLEVCELDRCDFLECKIEEYSLEDDYFNDHFEGNYFYNSFGMEKGCVVELYHREDNNTFYQYSPLGIDRGQYRKWYDQMRKDILKNKNHVLMDIAFWKLTQVSCVPIYRDREWFNNKLIKLSGFWQDVLHYRQIGTETLKTPARGRKKNMGSGGIFINTEIGTYVEKEYDQKVDDMYNEYYDTDRIKNICLFSNPQTVVLPEKQEDSDDTSENEVEHICLFSSNNFI